jgi:hypothetical protein
MLRIVAPLLVAGCGLGWIDNVDDRTEGLPTAGAGPYARLEIDDTTPAGEPVVISDRDANLRDPSALARDDGGFRVWFTRVPDADPAATDIQYAEAPSPHDLVDVGPTVVLAADQAWEGAGVASPAVLADGDELVMYYQAGAPVSIGVARSPDGITWTKTGSAPVLADAFAPSAVIVDGATWLFVERPGLPGIWRAVDSGTGFVLDAAPVVVARPELAEAFDRNRVSDPFALAVRQGDATRVHLWFVGVTFDPPDKPAVGYAASLDGVTWPRFGAGKPMLVPEATGPTVVLEASGGLMLFTEVSRGHLAITAAEHP